MRDSKTHRILLSKSVQNCNIKYISTKNGIPHQHTSDCAASEGASGSAVLDVDLRNPTLFGIAVGVGESKAEIIREYRTGIAINHEFDREERHLYTLDTPVNGEFAEAIRNAAAADPAPDVVGGCVQGSRRAAWSEAGGCRQRR